MIFFKNYILILLLLFIGCKTQKTGSVSIDKLDSIIAKKLGADNTKSKNFEGSYILAFSDENNGGTTIIRYGVWEISSGELIYAGTAVRGNVKWLDNTTLLVEDYPGIVEEGRQNYKFRVDLNTKVKTPVYESENK